MINYLKSSLKSIWEKRDKDIESLNGLRSFSIIAVIIFHIYAINPGIFPQDFPFILIFLSNLNSGVDLFFLLSGFLIYGVLYVQWEKNATFSFKKFYINRSLRIFPAYYFFIFISFQISKAQYKIMSKSSLVSKIQLDQMAKGLNSWIFEALYISNYKTTLNIHTWSLSVEEQFYLIFPLICYFILFRLSNKWRLIFLIGLFFSGAIIRYITFYNFDLSSSNPTVIFGQIYQRFHTRFDSIITGVIAFELYKNWGNILQSSKKSINSLFFISGIAVLIFCNLLAKIETSVLYAVFRFSFLNIGFALLILASIYNFHFNKLLSSKIFLPIARLSYGMYLWHFAGGFLSGGIMVYFKKSFNSITWIEFLVLFVLTLIFALILALFSYIFIEYPFLRIKEKLNRSS